MINKKISLIIYFIAIFLVLSIHFTDSSFGKKITLTQLDNVGIFQEGYFLKYVNGLEIANDENNEGDLDLILITSALFLVISAIIIVSLLRYRYFILFKKKALKESTFILLIVFS
jgi:hypothetical protein